MREKRHVLIEANLYSSVMGLSARLMDSCPTFRGLAVSNSNGCAGGFSTSLRIKEQ